MNYTELFDNIDELLESGDLIVSNGRLYSAVDELDEGIIGAIRRAHAQSNIVNAQTNTDPDKAEKLNKKAEKSRDYLDKLARSKFKGTRQKAKEMADKIQNRLTSAKDVNDKINTSSETATTYRDAYKKEAVHGKEAPVTESVLVFNMPDTIMLTESDNYEFFLEQVLAYNGFKVTENNVNVLHAALENGHAVIE